MIAKGCLLLLLLVVAPYCTGGLLAPLLPEKKRTIAHLFLSGLLLQFALFEIVAVVCMLTIAPYIPFLYARRIYGVLSIVCAVCGLAVLIKKKIPSFSRPNLKYYNKETLLYWALFFALVIAQMYMAFTRASFDGDDAYYVVQSLQSQETDTMYGIEPYTGQSTRPDMRHALAVVTLWEAFIAKTASVHATIFAHTILPLFVIPLVYLIYYLFGKILFRDHADRLPVFMTLLAVFMMFGNTSIYTAETFFLTRTWQGKALMANVAVPLILWLFAWIFTEETTYMTVKTRADFRDQYAPWALLALTGFFCGACTSIGVLLGAGLIVVSTVALMIYARSARYALYGLCAVIPNAAYMLLYVLLRR